MCHCSFLHAATNANQADECQVMHLGQQQCASTDKGSGSETWGTKFLNFVFQMLDKKEKVFTL